MAACLLRGLTRSAPLIGTRKSFRVEESTTTLMSGITMSGITCGHRRRNRS